MPDDPQDTVQNLRVLLVEDNPAVAATLRLFIERSGMQTAWAPTVGRAIELKASFRPDVALVDLELPDADGMVLIEWLAGMHDCGIIVVSGQGDEAQRIVGLETGADDYISKPPQLRELVARIRAVHRRASQRWTVPVEPAPPPETQAVQVGPWRVDLQRRAVLLADGSTLALSTAEFVVLQELMLARGEAVRRERLSEQALHRPWQPEDRSVDQLVFSLRRKLRDGDDGLRLIQSVRGAGYILAATQRPADA
jgi:DNA-binding response OmpR family regulator